jgi:signal transduction histidine kinase
LATALGLFALDILTIRGIGDGIGYSIVLMLCLWSPRQSTAFAWACFATILVVSGAFLSIDGGVGTASLINRLLALSTIWVVWGLIRTRFGTVEALKLREREARQASETKSAFLANMSHEFRTPLNAILGFSDMLRTDLVRLTDEKRREYVEDIHSSASHLLSLIDDVLDLARIGAGKSELNEERFDLGVLVTEAVRMMNVAAKQKSLTVKQEIAPDMPGIRADRRLMKQVVLNVLSNAIKFNFDHGSVDIRAGVSDSDIWLSIADTGIGIPQDVLTEIGRPFVRASNVVARAVGGTGLGLAICREVLALHGGSLVVASVENEGTSVRISLPLSRAVPRLVSQNAA